MRRGRVAYVNLLNASARSSRAPQYEYRVKRFDGAWRWHICQGAPIWEDGEIVRWVCVISDIEENMTLKASEEAAKEASRLKTEFVTSKLALPRPLHHPH